MTFDLPLVMCFRVTRYCNARCGFCLAPPDGSHPDEATLANRIDWLVARGVKTIHFCGGEPTIHRDLTRLLIRARIQSAKTKLTTNGITMPTGLLEVLRSTDSEVKVSLHGDRSHHDKMVGRAAFERTMENLRRLLAAGVSTSVQTTVVAGNGWVVNSVVQLCLTLGVRRLSILPFIPRGSGFGRRAEFGLSSTERDELRRDVKNKRRSLSGRLDLRWLDFTARPTYVVEADGQVVLEGATEATDRVLCWIPDCEPRAASSGRSVTPSASRSMHRTPIVQPGG